MLGNRGNRSRYRREKSKKNAIILIICILIISVVVVGIKFIPKQDKENVQVTTNSDEEINSGDKEVTGNYQELESNILDNSGYLSLEEDPNADDAAMVAENTKGLLNGTKQYPVRTDGKKVVYLTFDDGPSTTNTPGVLEVLDRYNVKATFFTLGKSIEANEEAKDILKETVKRGHAIANHTYGHDYSYLYPNRTMNVDNILSDLERSQNSMKAVLGQDFSTRVIRFPGGYWSWEGRTAMKEAMEQNGYYNVDWNALNKDAEGNVKNADELLQSTKDTIEVLGPNADSVVLLMHDTYGKEETVKALSQIIEYLQGKGFEFRTIK
ncbi:polysaccharide deacetylase family protein [uncultured Clostridium sp.]|uniref:polysaccharide deacetylase family protein n=1 Tax=uncultured Clostridium sp. TaxID=59620 RepID=UPI0025F29F03|nr:polysaccharide deacetylase family protein [uncultured Clostridium sp.]MDU4883811.1 polysaccharide deacetylase family protein [Clostridium celatum]MDU7077054.1 polysaccharide deacetylase family protein [Clostridium celatum]